MSLSTPHAERVRRYYEENTDKFLRLGQGTQGTIRRAVWGPGVKGRQEAMSYVDTLIAERVRDLAPSPALLDLGCGVGASLCHLSSLVAARGVGVTLSPTQIAIAQERTQALGLASRLRFVKADFCNLPLGELRAHLSGPTELAGASGETDRSPGFDAAFAIESFVHSASGRGFFEQASLALRPGGLLLVCDDFATEKRFLSESPSARWLERFRLGWRVGTLTTPDHATKLAREAGLESVERIPLTGYLELSRPRDQATAALMRTLGWLPLQNSYWGMLRGGDALQKSLKKGWIEYSVLVFRKF